MFEWETSPRQKMDHRPATYLPSLFVFAAAPDCIDLYRWWQWRWQWNGNELCSLSSGPQLLSAARALPFALSSLFHLSSGWQRRFTERNFTFSFYICLRGWCLPCRLGRRLTLSAFISAFSLPYIHADHRCARAPKRQICMYLSYSWLRL